MWVFLKTLALFRVPSTGITDNKQPLQHLFTGRYRTRRSPRTLLSPGQLLPRAEASGDAEGVEGEAALETREEPVQGEGAAQQREASLSLEGSLGQQPVDGPDRLSMTSRTLQEQTQAAHGLQGYLEPHRRIDAPRQKSCSKETFRLEKECS